MLKTLEFVTNKRLELVNITAEVAKTVTNSGIKSGMALVYCPHTSACITINESTDNNLKDDLTNALSKLFPYGDSGYTHVGSNADAHIKMSILGESHSLIVENNAIMLGQWQSIYLCELDGPRNRHIHIKIISD